MGFVAQLTAQEFACGCLGQLFHDLDMARILVVCKTLLAKLDQLFRCNLALKPVFEGNIGSYCLTPVSAQGAEWALQYSIPGVDYYHEQQKGPRKTDLGWPFGLTLESYWRDSLLVRPANAHWEWRRWRFPDRVIRGHLKQSLVRLAATDVG